MPTNWRWARRDDLSLRRFGIWHAASLRYVPELPDLVAACATISRWLSTPAATSSMPTQRLAAEAEGERAGNFVRKDPIADVQRAHREPRNRPVVHLWQRAFDRRNLGRSRRSFGADWASDLVISRRQRLSARRGVTTEPGPFRRAGLRPDEPESGHARSAHAVGKRLDYGGALAAAACS
jgi:hypothetical protein